MGLYTERVVPRLVDLCCGMHVNDDMRQRVCAGLTGRVLELGFGSGHNVPFYPAAVISVDAVEPADVGWRLAAPRIAASPVPVQRSGRDAAALPYGDDTFDAALSTWTLCTIPEVVGALHEVRRVLTPGASLHLVEHGLAPDARVRRWQSRLDPVHKRVVGGCHLTRPVVSMIEDAGFVLAEVEVFYEPGAPKALGAMTLARAVSP